MVSGLISRRAGCSWRYALSVLIHVPQASVLTIWTAICVMALSFSTLCSGVLQPVSEAVSQEVRMFILESSFLNGLENTVSRSEIHRIGGTVLSCNRYGRQSRIHIPMACPTVSRPRRLCSFGFCNPLRRGSIDHGLRPPGCGSRYTARDLELFPCPSGDILEHSKSLAGMSQA